MIKPKWVSTFSIKTAHCLTTYSYDSVCGIKEPYFGWFENDQKPKCKKCLKHQQKWRERNE